MEPIYVSSPDNSLLKEYIKLHSNKRYRQKTKQIALEGPNLVTEAHRAGLTPRAVFYTEEYYDRVGKIWLDSLPSGVKKLILSPRLFNKIAKTESPQPVAAIFHFSEWEEDQKDLAVGTQLVIILDHLQDPGNMGTIIRTAAAAGAGITYYTSGSVDPYSPKVLRATAGTVFNLQLKQVRDSLKLCANLKDRGFQVVASCADSSVHYWSVDYRKPTALLVGNEAGGIAKELSTEADQRVSIPLSGPVESLNVAVACGIIIYEIIRQRSV